MQTSEPSFPASLPGLDGVAICSSAGPRFDSWSKVQSFVKLFQAMKNPCLYQKLTVSYQVWQIGQQEEEDQINQVLFYSLIIFVLGKYSMKTDISHQVEFLRLNRQQFTRIQQVSQRYEGILQLECFIKVSFFVTQQVNFCNPLKNCSHFQTFDLSC